MPWGLKRYYGAGDLHFITCSCYQRQPLLGTAQRRNLFLVVLPPCLQFAHTSSREPAPPVREPKATATELRRGEGCGCPISRVFCEKWGFSSRIRKNLKPSPENRAPRPPTKTGSLRLTTYSLSLMRVAFERRLRTMLPDFPALKAEVQKVILARLRQRVDTGDPVLAQIKRSTQHEGGQMRYARESNRKLAD